MKKSYQIVTMPATGAKHLLWRPCQVAKRKAFILLFARLPLQSLS